MIKKFFGIAFASVLTFLSIPLIFATNTNNYNQGTEVVYQSTLSEEWTITVPAKLSPNQSGTVTLQGYWPSNRTIHVSAPDTVTLTNNLLSSNKKDLPITFTAISATGNNNRPQTFTSEVAVGAITNALFGKWSGTFYYNVNVTTANTTFTYFFPDAIHSQLFTVALSEDSITIEPSDLFYEEAEPDFGSKEDIFQLFQQLDVHILFQKQSSDGFIEVAAEKSIDKTAFTFPLLGAGVYEIDLGIIDSVLAIAPTQLPENLINFNSTYTRYQYTDNVAHLIATEIRITQSGHATFVIDNQSYSDQCVYVGDWLIPRNMFYAQDVMLTVIPSEKGSMLILHKNDTLLATYVTEDCSPNIRFEEKYIVTEADSPSNLGYSVIFHKDGTYDLYDADGVLESTQSNAWEHIYEPYDITDFGTIQDNGQTIVSDTLNCILTLQSALRTSLYFDEKYIVTEATNDDIYGTHITFSEDGTAAGNLLEETEGFTYIKNQIRHDVFSDDDITFTVSDDGSTITIHSDSEWVATLTRRSLLPLSKNPIKFGEEYICLDDQLEDGELAYESFVFYEDGSFSLSGSLSSPGQMIYTENTLIYGDITGQISSDGKSITLYYEEQAVIILQLKEPKIIPEGGTYYRGLLSDTYLTGDYTGATSIYQTGDYFPDAQVGDVYIYGDYEYRYGYELTADAEYYSPLYNLDLENIYWSRVGDEYLGANQWGVSVRRRSQTQYDPALNEIGWTPTKNLSYTYANCTNLVTAPELPTCTDSLDSTFAGCIALIESPIIPASTTTLDCTFYLCESLTKAPIIPNKVIGMSQTFNGCTRLTTMTTIPESVDTMNFTFHRCSSLTGTIEINAELYWHGSNAFYGIDFEAQNLHLTGSCPKFAEMTENAINYCPTCQGKCYNNH